MIDSEKWSTAAPVRVSFIATNRCRPLSAKKGRGATFTRAAKRKPSISLDGERKRPGHSDRLDWVLPNGRLVVPRSTWESGSLSSSLGGTRIFGVLIVVWRLPGMRVWHVHRVVLVVLLSGLRLRRWCLRIDNRSTNFWFTVLRRGRTRRATLSQADSRRSRLLLGRR